ncbi:chondroitinase family polysaccharide lyase [Streptomyces sp. NPDC005480]|uniref:chondroitinase family polysaccharide lyase n=1 Tax=Streptomyces sp. NPDC005480 TaxID=3154880 RepID=UPI0033B186C5
MSEAPGQFTRRTALQAGAVLAAGTAVLPIGGVPAAAATGTDATDLEQRALALEPPAFLLESHVPERFRAGRGTTLTISDRTAVCGDHSLRWDHAPKSVITIDADLSFTPDAYRPGRLPGADQCWQGTVDTFSVWLYNEEPVDDVVRFEFGQGERVDAWFDFGLDFTGWRTAWVRYGYDLKGRPHRGMDTVRLVAPRRSGTLHVDQLILNTSVRPDNPTRDAQVPFVATESDDWDNAHWQGLLLFDTLLRRNRLPTPRPSAEETASLRALTTRYHDEYLAASPTVTDTTVASLSAQVEALGIPGPGTTGPGRPIVSYQAAVYPAVIAADLTAFVGAATLRAVTDQMKSVAQAWDAADTIHRPALAELYLRIVRHLRDQGWQSGSSQGTIHHFGYDARGLYDSVFLMRDALRDAGLLEAVRADVTWFSGLGRIFRDWTSRQSHGGIMDIFNTTVRGMLAAVLLMDTEAEQVAYLHALLAWLNTGLLPSPGVQDGIKGDGSAFHHIGFYPDYVRDGLTGLAPILYVLSGGVFRIAPDAHASLKKTLLTMRAYANTFTWPLPLTGRHPTGATALSITPYQWMAFAGTPDGSGNIDPELGAAYLRLLSATAVPSTAQKRIAQRLTAAGITAEPSPTGNWHLNYAALGLHRRDDWLVAVRGHNRYLWSTEVYDGSNWYGRYSTYGQIAIVNQGTPLNVRSSGFSQAGWDWNRWPGTTAIHVPAAQLKADLTGAIEEMLLTDSRFGGALSIDGRNGMFAMELHEHPKYDDSHRALKSVFCFDDRVVAVGSGITNSDPVNPTETTLFQTALSTPSAPTYLDEPTPITQFPYERTDLVRSARWLLDDKRIGYYVPAGQLLGLQRSTQTSRDQGTDQPTSGDFAAAWIRHGTAPKDAGYQYAMVVDSTADEMAAFAAAMNDRDEAPYSVDRADRHAHVVTDRATGITAYAVLRAVNRLPGPVQGVDTPSLIMARSEDSALIIAVGDPDLRLYEGVDDDQYQGGVYVGRYTSFSRPWMTSPSATHRLRITLAGHWAADGSDHSDRSWRAARQGGGTVLEVETVDGHGVQIRLVPATR